ncbi:aminotransferase class V-fold PLP-dependent enzyme [Cupriavidus sp. AcVe19-6a]|nr:aminotransferase class V-fold PLP-dependent enzyme [Cupriavidus sp. AcVe19-6a]
MSLPVKEAIEKYMTSWVSDGMDWESWMEAVEGSCAEFARLIGAERDEIAILGSVSDAASSIVSCLDLTGSRKTLVCSELDFPSLGHVMLAQQARGARVRFVESDQQGISLDAIKRAFDASTALACLSHVSYYNAARINVQTAADNARQNGALLFVDAYQSAGALAIDVKEMGLDILASGAQKFLLGVPGIAFMYVKGAVARQWEPRNTGWFGRSNPFSFDIRTLDFSDHAARFNTGTPPIICAYAAQAGMKLLNEIGSRSIDAYLQHLSLVGREEARLLGLAVAGPIDPGLRGSVISVQISEAAKVEKAMKAAGYIVSARNDVIRVAPHFYNTEDEVVCALRELSKLVS